MAYPNREQCMAELAGIGGLPVAPFHEARVARRILARLVEMDVPIQQDRYGNIVACYEGPNAPESGGIGLAAHMDHPAIDIIDRKLACLLGSVRREYFNVRVPILVYPSVPPDDGAPDPAIRGHITGFDALEGKPPHLALELESNPRRMPAFGVWDMPPVEFRENRAYMRAADDVAGCAMVLLALEELSRNRVPCRCYGIFTRAEETGFIGVTALVREDIIPRDVVIVSIETSKALPGAEIGGGPVIRVGDAIMTFDGRAETMLLDAREQLIRENPDARIQRQLMSGGGCEGTVYMLAGFPTTGLAIPLGNYHNMGENGAISPEYIDLDDFSTGVSLLVRAASRPQGEYASLLEKKLFGFAEGFHARLE